MFFKKHIINSSYIPRAVETIMRLFNEYIDAESPFEDCNTNDKIGFSWLQIKTGYPKFALMAVVALKLHATPCSEA